MTRPEARNIGFGKTNILSRTVQHCYARFFEGVIPFAYGFNTGKIKVLGKRYLGYQYFDNVVLRARDMSKNPIGRPERRRFFHRFQIREAVTINSEWDSFFDEVCDSYTLLVRRDSKYLNWRYVDCPDKQYKIYAVYRGKKMVGWGVFHRDGNRMIWGDALFNRKYPDAVSHLLYNVHISDENRGIDRIEGWFSEHPRWWHEILDHNKFFIEEEPNGFSFCYKIFSTPDMSAELGRVLYYSSGDSDLF